MKYIVVEAVNEIFNGNHPSGFAVTDGDDDSEVWINRIGRPFNTKKEASDALEKYLEEVKELVPESELKEGWCLDYDCDDWSLSVYREVEYYEGCPEVEDSEWVIKCEIIAIPDDDEPVNKNDFCLLDLEKYWWGDGVLPTGGM